jgi:hypothetical protein
VAVAVALTVCPSLTHAQIEPLNVDLVAQMDEHPIDYQAADVWADDRGYAYVGNRLGPTVDIIDISDPTSPAIVTIYEIPPPNSGALALDVKVHHGLMYIGFSSAIGVSAQIVDVRDPADPQPLADVIIPGFNDVHNLFFDSGFLYMVNSHDARMAIIDLTDFDPDNPPDGGLTNVKWMIEDIGAAFVHDVTVLNGRAYASAWQSGIWVFDVTNIASEPPVLIANAPGDKTHSAWATEDGHWVVANEERSNGGPVKLYEMVEDEEGATLTHVSSVTIPTTHAKSSHNVHIFGRRLYVAWYNRGLMAYNITNDGLLELVAHYDTSVDEPDEPFRGAWGVYPFLGRDRILMSDKDTQFWIFDVRIPGSGDFTGDVDVDLKDFAGFQECIGTDGEPYVEESCEIFDIDFDDDVDLTDHELLIEKLAGPTFSGSMKVGG